MARAHLVRARVSARARASVGHLVRVRARARLGLGLGLGLGFGFGLGLGLKFWLGLGLGRTLGANSSRSSALGGSLHERLGVCRIERESPLLPIACAALSLFSSFASTVAARLLG